MRHSTRVRDNNQPPVPTEVGLLLLMTIIIQPEYLKQKQPANATVMLPLLYPYNILWTAFQPSSRRETRNK